MGYFNDVVGKLQAVEQAKHAGSEVAESLLLEIDTIEAEIDSLRASTISTAGGQSFAEAVKLHTQKMKDLEGKLSDRTKSLALVKQYDAPVPFTLAEIVAEFGELTNQYQKDSLAILEADIAEKKAAYLESIDRAKEACLEQQAIASRVQLVAQQVYGVRGQWVPQLRSLNPDLFINKAHRSEDNHF